MFFKINYGFYSYEQLLSPAVSQALTAHLHFEIASSTPSPKAGMGLRAEINVGTLQPHGTWSVSQDGITPGYLIIPLAWH